MLEPKWIFKNGKFVGIDWKPSAMQEETQLSEHLVESLSDRKKSSAVSELNSGESNPPSFKKAS